MSLGFQKSTFYKKNEQQGKRETRDKMERDGGERDNRGRDRNNGVFQDLHRFISVSPAKLSTGGVLACEDEVCEAADIEDADVDGRPDL